MNKTELISAMAERSGLSKKDTEKALTAALETIAAALAAGDRVQLVLRHLGTPGPGRPHRPQPLYRRADGHSCRPPACV